MEINWYYNSNILRLRFIDSRKWIIQFQVIIMSWKEFTREYEKKTDWLTGWASLIRNSNKSNHLTVKLFEFYSKEFIVNFNDARIMAFFSFFFFLFVRMFYFTRNIEEKCVYLEIRWNIDNSTWF